MADSAGFTLIELMIVVVIIGVMLGLAAPSFRSFILDQRLRATSADLRIAILTARSESVKRNRNVVITPRSSNWSNGWEIANPDASLPDILTHVIDNPTIAVSLESGTVVGFRANGRAQESIDFEVSAGTGSYLTQKCLTLEVDGSVSEEAGECT
jgi:type IV fimbrial biogenesis protein FimT